MKPVNDYLIVTKMPIEEVRTKAGILLPEKASGMFVPVKVHAVGPGDWLPSGARATPPVKVGDRALVKAHSLLPCVLRGEDVMILMQQDIVAIFEEGDSISGPDKQVKLRIPDKSILGPDNKEL